MGHDEHERLGEPDAYWEKLKSFMLPRPRTDWLLVIPHWLILLSFVLPWSAFLIWRTRKRMKLLP